jgi:hypothetical protein
MLLCTNGETLQIDRLDSAAPSTEMGEERDQKQNQKDNKQQLRNAGRCNRYAAKAQDRGDQSHHQKRYCPVQHDNPPVKSCNSGILASAPKITNPLEAVGYDPGSGNGIENEL